MNLTKRWEKQNSLIQRVRQHGAMTTLFRAVDERTATLPPFTVGTTLAPSPTPALADGDELSAHLLEAPADQSWSAASPLVEPALAARQSMAAGGEAVTPAVAQPMTASTLMRATLPAPVAAPAPTPLVPLMAAPPALLSPPSQGVEASRREQSSPPAPLVPTDLGTSRPTVPSATVLPRPQPVPGAGNTSVAPSAPPAAPLPTLATGATGAPALQRTPAEEPTSSGMDDVTWTRLRAIVRKHQARAVGEDAASAAPPAAPDALSAPSVPVTPASPSGNPLQRRVTASAPTDLPAISAPVSSITPSVAGLSVPVAPIPQEMSVTGQTEMPMAWPAAVATPLTPSIQTVQQQPFESTASTLGVSSPSPASGSPPLPSAGMTVDAAFSTALPVAADLPLATTNRDIRDEVATTDWPQEDAAQTPLQAVWPVQRLTDTGAEGASALTSELPAYIGPPPPEPPELRRQLSALPPAQPTESSIDLVLPRRPRPARPDTAAPTAAVNQSATSALQRQVAPAASPASSDHSLLTGTVPTEIGPLPADLWQLIGEKPPQTAPLSAPVAAAPVQRAPATHVTNMVNEPPVPMLTTPQPSLLEGNRAVVVPDLLAAEPEVSYAAPMLSSLAPEPGQTLADAAPEKMMASSAFVSPASISQPAEQAMPPVINTPALTPSAAAHELDLTEEVQPLEKKTRAARQAQSSPATTRRRRKRVTPA